MPLTDIDTPLSVLRERLRSFNAARDWGRYHTPRNLAMAVSVEAAELLIIEGMSHELQAHYFEELWPRWSAFLRRADR